MNSNTAGSFLTRMRQKFFKWRINREIFDRISPHRRGEKDFGYPFITDEQMKVQTEELDVQAVLDSIERQIRQMPKAYGESFRYILHRDLHARLRMFEQVARRRVQPTSCDPRFVATHA